MEAPASEDAANFKNYIDLDAYVSHVAVTRAFDEAEIHSMKVKPVLFDNTEDNQDKSEEVAVFKLDGNAVSAVKVIRQRDQIKKVAHFSIASTQSTRSVSKPPSARTALTTSWTDRGHAEAIGPK